VTISLAFSFSRFPVFNFPLRAFVMHISVTQRVSAVKIIVQICLLFIAHSGIDNCVQTPCTMTTGRPPAHQALPSATVVFAPIYRTFHGVWREHTLTSQSAASRTQFPSPTCHIYANYNNFAKFTKYNKPLFRNFPKFPIFPVFPISKTQKSKLKIPNIP
jgi:hypothetical protein